MFVRKCFLIVLIINLFTIIILFLQLYSSKEIISPFIKKIYNDIIYNSNGNDTTEKTRKDSKSEFHEPEIREGAKCQSLFTISEVPHLIRFPKGYLLESSSIENAVNNSLGKKNMHSLDTLEKLYQNLVEDVKIILVKRDLFPSDLSTDDYVRLAKVFSPIANYSYTNRRKEMSDTTTREEREEEEEGGNENIKDHQDNVYRRIPSRIKEDFLPFVPCSVKTYENNSEVFSCISQRLEGKEKLWIHFMGDSKIRYLLQEFLNRTDDVFHYLMEYKKETIPWIKLKTDFTHGLEDFIATSPSQPRMRITFSFRGFVEYKTVKTFQIPLEYREVREVEQLRKWANSHEPPPDLLVIGYTAWALLDHKIYGEKHPRFTPEVLEMLLEMHRKVVPLLEKISQRTRVLVLPQSRLRPNSFILDQYPSYRGASSNANSEWSESTFLYFLNLHRRLHSHSKSYLFEESKSKTHPLGSKIKKSFQKSGKSTADKDKFILSGNDSSETKVMDKNFFSKLKWLIQNTDDPDLHNGASVKAMFKKTNADTFHSRIKKAAELDRQERHDFPRKKDFDKSIENFTQDSIRSSDFPLPNQLPRELSTFHDYLSPSKETPGLWWWDAIIPLNMASLLQCQEMFQKGLMEDFLYKADGLRCLDTVHAGKITLHDLGTMLLNLLCNSVLHIPSNYCCT